MGYVIERAIRTARRDAYRDGAWLTRRRIKAAKAAAAAATERGRVAAAARLEQVDAAIAAASAVGVSTATPGPHGRLTAGQFAVLLALADIANDGTREACARIDVVAGSAGVTAATAKSAINVLTAAGFLRQVGETARHVATWRVEDVVSAWRAEVARSGIEQLLDGLRSAGDRWDDDAQDEPPAEADAPDEPAPVPSPALRVVPTPVETSEATDWQAAGQARLAAMIAGGV